MIFTIPNILSFTRIIVSLILIAFSPYEIPFYIGYVICGITDVLDGYIARHTGTCSKLGAQLDSVGDFVFIAVVLFKIIPILNLQMYILIWVFLIAAVKLLSLIIGYVRYKKLAFLHTYANKLTGGLLFCMPILYGYFKMQNLDTFICVIASIAAAEEIFINIKSKELNRDIRGIIDLKHVLTVW